MAYSTTNLYPEDLNGTNPANLIKNEPQTLQAPGPKDYYFIIPKAAPFFVDSLKVVNSANGQPYVEGADYQVGHLFIEAMDSIGRPIAGSIRFMRPTIIGQVLLTYQTLGGNWGFSDADILRELSNRLVNPLIRSWGDIAPLPYSFPPLPHDQRIDTLIGSKQLNDSLNRIGDILEATAAGTSQSHIADYNNPHRVTKTQVGLGNVPNFFMASDDQNTDATRNDLFTNPRGVLLIVQKFALAPLDTHIANVANPHRVDKIQVGLGNVPNFAKATPTQAVDTTNDTTLMTPYTTSLLVQRLSNDPRLDQLIIDFNDHITANNPHHITPSLIGTYSSIQIDQKINAISQGGNATTFDGEDASQWEAKFPATADINDILNQLNVLYTTALTALNQIIVTDPVTPADKAQEAARRISWSECEYNAYGLNNSLGAGQIVTDSSIGVGFPTGPVNNLAGRWSATATGQYYIAANGTLQAWGSNPVPIPSIYTVAVTDPAAPQKLNAVFGSKDYLIVVQQDGKVVKIPRTGAATTLSTEGGIISLSLNNGMTDPRTCTILKNTSLVWKPLGDAGWVTAINGLISQYTSASRSILDARVGTGYLLVITTNGTETANQLKVYRINYDATITLTDVTSTTQLNSHADGTVITANTLVGLKQVAGSYQHFVFTKPISAGSDLCDLYSFGDNSQGQLEITTSSGPFLNAGAGYGFTVMINSMNYPEFWGNTPDNSMFWRGGPRLVTPTT